MRCAVCPGSFDPLHNGHLEVIARASNLFNDVIVAVANNPAKTYTFSLEDRLEMARETLSALRGISVMAMSDGLLAEFCRKNGADAIVKGVRTAADFDFEVPMATMNRHLTGVETVFLAADTNYQHLSSSLLKEVNSLGGDISGLVPGSVLRRMRGTPNSGQQHDGG